MNNNEITINGETYVLKSSIPEYTHAPELDGMLYCIVRTHFAGIYAGYLEKLEGQQATIRHARYICYWDGPYSLLSLSKHGVHNPNECSFTVEIDKLLVTEAIEIIPCTERGMTSIKEVPPKMGEVMGDGSDSDIGTGFSFGLG